MLLKAKSKYLKDITPKRYQDQELIWGSVEPSNKELVMTAVDSLFGGLPKGLLMTGAVGTGKTALTCLGMEAIADRLILEFTNRYKLSRGVDIKPLPEIYANWMRTKISILFTSEFQMIRTITQWTKGKSSWDWADYAKYNLIILDDFGRAHRTDWSKTILDEFIDWMWSHSIPVWITTNWHYQDLDNMRSPDSASEYKRIADRILDPSWTMLLSTGNCSRRK